MAGSIKQWNWATHYINICAYVINNASVLPIFSDYVFQKYGKGLKLITVDDIFMSFDDSMWHMHACDSIIRNSAYHVQSQPNDLYSMYSQNIVIKYFMKYILCFIIWTFQFTNEFLREWI